MGRLNLRTDMLGINSRQCSDVMWPRSNVCTLLKSKYTKVQTVAFIVSSLGWNSGISINAARSYYVACSV